MDYPNIPVMKYENALELATSVMNQLAPHCEQIIIAGSIRRQKGWVKDIEIVCQPKRDEIRDLFGNVTGHTPIHGFVSTIQQWERVKGDADGKYTQRKLPVYNADIATTEQSQEATINIDIFMTQADNYGLILMIRTGSAEFSKKMVGTVAAANGYTVDGGNLWKGKTKIAVPDEETLFKLFNRFYVKPEERF